MFRKIYENLTLADYEAAKEAGTTLVVKRFSRGNIFLNNGMFLTRNGLNALSKRGDRALSILKKKVASH